MRPPIAFVLVGTLGLAAALAACGGSASESPWPVEPEHREGAPVNEAAAPGTPLDERTPDSRGEVSADGPRHRAGDDAGAPIPAAKTPKRPPSTTPNF
jgi:hypothetical protein